jgi:uncharacterized protein (DUF4415 family)
MQKRKENSASASSKRSRGAKLVREAGSGRLLFGRMRTNKSRVKQRRVVDPDDAPEITDDMLDRAEIVKDGKVIQRGRPPIGDRRKEPVTIRLDPEILEAYRTSGPGWQGRINADLLQLARKKRRA